MPEIPSPYELFKLPGQNPAMVFERMSAAAQAITQAQARYGEAILRANMAIFSAWFPQASAAADAEGPVKAARKSEFTQT